MVPGTTKIQLALKVWPVIGGQTFSVDLLLSRVRPLGLPGLPCAVLVAWLDETHPVDCAMAASRRGPTNKFVLTLLVVGETLDV
jgi:hypothetical protein